jgi:hypothetical protein
MNRTEINLHTKKERAGKSVMKILLPEYEFFTLPPFLGQKKIALIRLVDYNLQDFRSRRIGHWPAGRKTCLQ